MDFIFDKDKLEEIHTIVSFYKKFDRYKDNTREELYYHILPSFELKQYKIHKHGDEVIAFTNWAFLNQEAENHLIKTGEVLSWNCGDKVWHIDTVCVKNIVKVMRWTKQYFTNLLGLGKPVHWLRLDENNKVYRKATRYTKEIYK